MAFKMKSGPKGPMKKNFPGAFKLKDGDEVEKNTRDVKNPVKNPRKYPELRKTMDVARGTTNISGEIKHRETQDIKKKKPELKGQFKSRK